MNEKEKNELKQVDENAERVARLIKSLPEEKQLRMLDIATGAVIQLTHKPVNQKYTQT